MRLVTGREHGSPKGGLSEQLNKLKDELLRRMDMLLGWEFVGHLAAGPRPRGCCINTVPPPFWGMKVK